MEKYYVYRHVRLDTNVPFYIGVGTKPKTYSSHESEYSRAFRKSCRSVFWKRVTEKTEYKVEIIYEANTLEEVYLKEVEFIELYGRRDLSKGSLVNLTCGGVGIKDVAKGVRDKISNAQKGACNNPEFIKGRSDRIKLLWQNPEFRNRMEEKVRARVKDKDYLSMMSTKAKERWKSETYRSQKSEEAKEMWKNPEYKALMGKKSSDRWLDDEYRNKVISTSRANRQLPENKEKRKNLMRELKGMLVVDKETGIFYTSLPEACETVGVNYKKEKSRLDKGLKISRFIRATDT